MPRKGRKGRRKRPGKHTVHPTDPRYNVDQYSRGSGSLVTREGVTKTAHAWAVDDGMIAHPVYDEANPDWRGDHNRSDVRGVDYHPINKADVKRYTLWRKRLQKTGMRDPDNPGKTLPPSHPLTKLRIERINTELDYANRKISLSEYQTRITRNERREKEAKLKLQRVVREIHQLSSGTMSTLTGYTKYEDLDRERNDFASWTEGQLNSGKSFSTWQDAWKVYNEGQRIKSTVIYAGSKKEARSKVEAKFGKVKDVKSLGEDHMGNPYYRVTFTSKKKGSKRKT